MRKRLIALVAVGAVVAPAAGVLAHRFTGTTATTIDYVEKKERFNGRIGSTHEECLANRRGKLVVDTSGSFETVARTRSNAEGDWRVRVEDAKGGYRAIVKRRAPYPTDEHDHDCRRTMSSQIVVGGSD